MIPARGYHRLPVAADSAIMDRARFAAVEASAEYSAALAYEPRVASWIGVAIASSVVGIGILSGCVWLAIAILMGAPLSFIALGALFSGVFVGFAGLVLRGALRYHAAPIERRVAVVLDKRYEVHASEDSTTTHYFTTLAFVDGTRIEVDTESTLTGLLTRGDIGVAYLKLTTLVGYRRFDC
jgi:hypothetical protein